MSTETATRIYMWLHVAVWPILIVLCFSTGAWFAGAMFSVAWVMSVVWVIREYRRR